MFLESALIISLHINESIDKKVDRFSTFEKFKKQEQHAPKVDAETEFLFKKLFKELEKQNPTIKIND